MATMMQLTETIPTHQENGKVWLKPSIAQGLIYLNGAFRPFAGGDTTYSYTIPLTVFIRGIDRTAFTKIESFEKNDFLYEKVDTLNFILDDKDNVVDLTEGEEVVVFKKDSESDTPVIWFAGYVDDIRPTEFYSGARKFRLSVTCNDYTKWLDKSLVIQEYIGLNAYDIIADIVDDYAFDFYIPQDLGTPLVDKVKFNYKSGGECIKQIAELVNYYWYVDYEKTIKFFNKSSIYAPFEITESLVTSGHYKDMQINVNKTELRNRIFVRGGTYLSNLFQEEFVADGVQTAFKLAYNPRNPVNVYVNNVVKTLGIDNISTTSEFLVNYTNQVILNGTYATLSAGDVLKVTYKYEIQVLTQDDDAVSQAYMRLIESGSGIYSYLITDTEILSIDTAHARASAELQSNAYPVTEGGFMTDQDGYRSGQTLVLKLPSWGYDNFEVVIQSVRSRLQNSNKFFYDIVFAGRKKTLVEFLTEMRRFSVAMMMSSFSLTEETLNDLSIVSGDSIQFDTEGTPSFAERNPATNPYKWGADADQFNWSEGQWE